MTSMTRYIPSCALLMNRVLGKIVVAVAAITAVAAVFLSSPTALAASALEEKLAQTKEDTLKLAELRDDTTLSDTEQWKQEKTLTVKILLTILEISQLQLDETQRKLGALQLPNTDDWADVKTALLARIQKDRDYYTTTHDLVRQNNAYMLLPEVKTLAQEIERYKTADGDQTLRRINSLITAFNIDAMLSLGDKRVEKIGSDITKIYNRKLTKNTALKSMFTKASEALEQAHKDADRAKEVMLYVYTSPATSTATTTSEFIEALTDEIRGLKEATLAKTESDTSKSKTASLSRITVTDDDVDEYIQTRIVAALDRIRAAYDIFKTMSTNAKTYLQ